MKKGLLIGAVVMLSGCASVGSLPNSTADVDFDQVGRGVDKSWHDGAVYIASKRDVMTAATKALRVNGFTIERSSEADCSIVGSTPTTMQTWSSVVGVYCRELPDQLVKVHVMAKSTKDVNALAGDATTPIPPRIISSLSSYLPRGSN